MVSASNFRTVVRRLMSSSYVNNVRTFEWLKHDDEAVIGEFKRARFLLFLDQQPLLTVLPPATSENRPYELCYLDFEHLRLACEKMALPLDPQRATALLFVGSSSSLANSAKDSRPQSESDEPETIFAYGLRSKDVGVASPEDRLKLRLKLREHFGSAIDFVDLRRVMLTMTDVKSAHLLAKGQSLLRWSNSFRFCPSCGSKLTLLISKAIANCPACNKSYFPQVSPVAISLVRNAQNTHCLLVRMPASPPGVFTALSGFAETGEAIEETVRREVAEEVGIDADVSSIAYAGLSQSWPFPHCSLMLAFTATADSSQPAKIDKSELADADWFSSDDVHRAYLNTLNYSKKHLSARRANNSDASKSLSTDGGGEINERFCFLPPPGAIAFSLVRQWLISTGKIK